MITRRSALEGLGLIGLSGSALATSITVPPIRLIAAQLTQGGWARGQVWRGSRLRLDGAPVPVDENGYFIVAFDRDAGPSATLSNTLADGNVQNLPLSISPRAWQIEHVAVGPRPGAAPSAEYERRRAPELARINAARQIDSHSGGWRQNFIWPAKGRISGRFGSQRIYRGTPGGYHSGVDVSTGRSGDPYVAPADGVVILAAQSPFTLEGHLLMLDHGMGLNSAFLHAAQLLVDEGQVVRQGQVLGRIGMTGRATGPHLHWSMKWRNSRLDPMLFAGTMG